MWNPFKKIEERYVAKCNRISNQAKIRLKNKDRDWHKEFNGMDVNNAIYLIIQVLTDELIDMKHKYQNDIKAR